MKLQLVVLIGCWSVALSSLSPTSYGQSAASPFHLLVPPLTTVGGHYRVEAEHPDGTVTGQYGYQAEGQSVQVAYSTVPQPQAPSTSDENSTAPTTDGSNAQVTANDTTPLVGISELTTSQQPQTQSALNPHYVAPLPYFPVQSYSQSNQVYPSGPFINTYPYVVSNAQTPQLVPQGGYYVPRYSTGQQGVYHRPASGVSVSQIRPTHHAVPYGYSGSVGTHGASQARPYYPLSVVPGSFPSRAPASVYSVLGSLPLSPSLSRAQSVIPHAINRYYQNFPLAYSAPQPVSHRHGLGHNYPQALRPARRHA